MNCEENKNKKGLMEVYGAVLGEVNHNNTENELKEAMELWGIIPELFIDIGDGKLAKIKANANMGYWKMEDDSYFEAQGICKLENGEFINIQYVAGMFMALPITPEEVVKEILKYKKYELLEAFRLERMAIDVIYHLEGPWWKLQSNSN